MWLRFGARMVWILEPSHRTLTVYRPGEPSRVLEMQDMLSGEDVLPGFTMPVTEIFDLP
jgi:Uma2 family endonuclease